MVCFNWVGLIVDRTQRRGFCDEQIVLFLGFNKIGLLKNPCSRYFSLDIIEGTKLRKKRNWISPFDFGITVLKPYHQLILYYHLIIVIWPPAVRSIGKVTNILTSHQHHDPVINILKLWSSWSHQHYRCWRLGFSVS